MKIYLKKGIDLFMYSTSYILFIALPYFIILDGNKITNKLGILVSLGFLILWFYWSYKNKLGFWPGILVGCIGASGGIILGIISLLCFFLNSLDGYSLYIVVPWMLPLTPLFEYIPSYGFINNFLGHISLILVIILTGIGGYIGRIKK